ncbi:MAG: DUF3108 domain-containing protein [Caulobacterales bacterium]
MRAVFAALALALAAAVPAMAQTGAQHSYGVVYNVQARGMSAGDFNFSFNVNGGQYTGTAERRLTGLARTLMGNSQDYNYSVRGNVGANGAVEPVAYRHSGGRKGRVVNADFSGDGIVTTATPEMGMGNPPATEAQKRDAIDQVSMFLGMMLRPGDPCRQTIKVYLDGRSRFDFVLTPNGTENVNIAGYRGQAQRCRVAYRPIAGFGDPQEPAEMTFLFARVNGVNAPLRIEMPSDDAGVIRLDARSFTAR